MKFVSLDEFTMMGIEARTSFAREKAGGVIPAMWGRVREGVLNHIPNKADSDVVALYTDYESDEYGEYTLVIGARVRSAQEVPAGMLVKHVPASRYAVFSSERGNVADVVIAAWKRIWNEPRTEEYSRSYRADFEVYGAQARDPENTSMEIFIGVK